MVQDHGMRPAEGVQLTSPLDGEEDKGSLLALASRRASTTVASERGGAPAARAEAARSAPGLEGRRILHVDDDATARCVAGMTLRKAGFDVTLAASGDEAFGLLAAGERFDVLITDYAMPGLNGADLVSKARAVQPWLPVVIITGFVEVEGMEAPPKGVLVLRKPFRRGDLLTALERLMAPVTS